MPRLATTSPQRVIITVTLGLCALLTVIVLAVVALNPVRLNSDFMAFWCFPRFAASHPIAQIYDAGILQKFETQLYPGFGSFYPYLYPPTFLLPSWWLKFFAFAPAQILWTLAGLALFTPAALLLFPRRWPVLLALLVSPASLLNIMTGETAYFTSGLILAGFALLPKRPILAGIAFGLLTLKPQLGVLLPLLLLARGDWRAIAAACITAAALIGLSCLAFPPSLWLLWFHTLPAYQRDYFASTGLNLNIIVTPGRQPGHAGRTAKRRLDGAVRLRPRHRFHCLPGRPPRTPTPLLPPFCSTGSFLAVPHAYAYDSITLTAAMALCLTPKTPTWQIILGAVIYLAPLALLGPAHHWFLYSLPETLLFAIIATLALARPTGAISPGEPKPVPAAQ